MPEAPIPAALPSLAELDNELISRAGLKEFVRLAWPIVEPGREFVPSWHIDAICDHLEAVTNGDIRRLLINIPPRHMKSLLVAVFWPTWVWTKDAQSRWIFASYAEKLSTRDSLKCRRIIQSPWYQDRWGDRFELVSDQNVKTRFENDKTGFRLATSVGGLATGEGGDVLVIDDAHKADEAQSDINLATVRTWHDEVWSTRLNDEATGARVVIGQRIHQKDLLGHLLGKGGWEQLILPTEYRPTTYVTGIGFEDPRIEEDELLWYERFPPEVIAQAKIDLGSFAFAGQHQQSPKSREGNIVKEVWLDNRFRVRGENPIIVVQSWDCLDDKTEILSAAGWVGRGEVKQGDLIYSFNTETHAAELVPVLNYGERTIYPEERMIKIESSLFNIRVTEGHRMYIGTIHGAKREKRYGFMAAGKLATERPRYIVPLSAECKFNGVSLTNDELKFIAWFITDGGFGNANKTYVKIAQAKDYKHEIRKLLVMLGFDFTEKIDNRPNRYPNARPIHLFKIPKGVKGGQYARNGWKKLGKWLDKDIADELMEMTREQFTVFFDELLKGDGCVEQRHLCCGCNKRMADRIQMMAVVRGFNSSVHVRKATVSGRDIWAVSVHDRKWRQSNPRVKAASRLSFDDVVPGEIVWCVENENQTIFIRRNGRVSISGNCASKAKERNDPSACLTLAEFKDRVEVWDYACKRREFPDLKRAAKDKYEEFKPNAVLIEDKDAGQQLIQTLKRETKIPVIAVNPGTLDKMTRLDAETPFLEAGKFQLPESAPWVAAFVDELTTVPAAAHDESADTVSQALRWLRLRKGKSTSGAPVSVGKPSGRIS